MNLSQRLPFTGFDFGIAGTCTAFESFQQQFGIPYPSQPSGYLITARVQSAWFGASIAGDVVGVAIAGQIMDIIGRKHTIGIGTVITAVGVGVQVASHTWEVFLAGRLINGMSRTLLTVWSLY